MVSSEISFKIFPQIFDYEPNGLSQIFIKKPDCPQKISQKMYDNDSDNS